MRLLAPIGLRWECYAVFILAGIVGCAGLDINTKVDIMYSKYFEDHILVTCSVLSSDPQEDVRKHNVYLHCPLIGDDKICYINCDNLLVSDRGTPILTEVFRSCEKTWNISNRIEYHYLLNKRNIGVTGQWHCAYKNQQSSDISIREYKAVRTVPTTTKSYIFTPEPSRELITCGQTPICPKHDNNTSVIAGTIIALTFSAIINVLLAVMFCVYRYEAKNSKRRKQIKDTDKSIAERQSLLSRFSHIQPGINHSLGSRTPSLDSPSNKESYSTYMQDTSHSNSCKSPSYYIHPDCRIIQVISPNSHQGANLEHQRIIPRQLSEELNPSMHAFLPIGPTKPLQNQRRSAQFQFLSYSPLDQCQQEMTVIPGRTYTSHQQLHNDSNDESGLGSESLCNGNTHKSTTFMGGSADVDLIHDCESNLMLNRVDT